MRNRLLVLANGVRKQRGGGGTILPVFRQAAPDHRDPGRESSRAVRLVPGGKSRGPSTFSSTALERFRVLRPVARVQPTSAYLDSLASI